MKSNAKLVNAIKLNPVTQFKYKTCHTRKMELINRSDVAVMAIDDDDATRRSIRILKESLIESGLNNGNDADESGRCEIINRVTINEMMTALPQMSHAQEEKVYQYIKNSDATLKEKRQFCQDLISTCYLAANQNAEEKRRICGEIEEYAVNCLDGASGGLVMIRCRIRGGNIELPMRESFRNSYLSNAPSEKHANSYFMVLFGGAIVDEFFKEFPYSLSMEDLSRITETNAFLTKQYVEDLVKDEAFKIIKEAQAQSNDQDDFINIVTEKLSNHNLKLMHHLSTYVYGRDPDLECSSLYKAGDKEIRAQIEEMVKFSKLGSKEVEIEESKYQLILKLLTLSESNMSAPIWLQKKVIKEYGGKLTIHKCFAELGKLIPNDYYAYSLSLMEKKLCELSKNGTSIQDLVSNGCEAEEIIAQINAGAPIFLDKTEGDFDISGLIGHPQQESILKELLKYIERNNSESMGTPYTANSILALEKAIKYGLRSSFTSKTVNALLSNIPTETYMESMNIVSVSCCISAIKAVRENPESLVKLMLISPSIINNIAHSKMAMSELGFKSVQDLLEQTLGRISDQKTKADVALNTILYCFPESKHREFNDTIKSVEKLLNKEGISHLFSHHENHKISLGSVIMNRLTPNIFIEHWKIWYPTLNAEQKLDLAKKNNEAKRTVLQELSLINIDEFRAMFKDICKITSHQNVAKLLTDISREGYSIISNLLKMNAEEFDKAFKLVVYNLSMPKMVEFLNAEHRNKITIAAMAAKCSHHSLIPLITTTNESMSILESMANFEKQDPYGKNLLMNVARYSPKHFNEAFTQIKKSRNMMTAKDNYGDTVITLVATNVPKSLPRTWEFLKRYLSKDDIANLLTNRNAKGETMPMIALRNPDNAKFFKEVIMNDIKTYMADVGSIDAEFTKTNQNGESLISMCNERNIDTSQLFRLPAPVAAANREMLHQDRLRVGRPQSGCGGAMRL